MASSIVGAVTRRVISSPFLFVRAMTAGEAGSGSGRGGGGGGDIRSAGGAFGKMEHAHEEQYFRKREQEQLKLLKKSLEEVVTHHQKEIKHHEEAIRRHREELSKHQKGVEKLEDKDDD